MSSSLALLDTPDVTPVIADLLPTLSIAVKCGYAYGRNIVQGKL